MAGQSRQAKILSLSLSLAHTRGVQSYCISLIVRGSRLNCHQDLNNRPVAVSLFDAPPVSYSVRNTITFSISRDHGIRSFEKETAIVHSINVKTSMLECVSGGVGRWVILGSEKGQPLPN